jgi:hypothetical protein
VSPQSTDKPVRRGRVVAVLFAGAVGATAVAVLSLTIPWWSWLY